MVGKIGSGLRDTLEDASDDDDSGDDTSGDGGGSTSDTDIQRDSGSGLSGSDDGGSSSGGGGSDDTDIQRDSGSGLDGNGETTDQTDSADVPGSQRETGAPADTRDDDPPDVDTPTPEEDTSQERSGSGPTAEEIDRREAPEPGQSPRFAGPGRNPPAAGIETGETAQGNRVNPDTVRSAEEFEERLIEQNPFIEDRADVAIRLTGPHRLQAELTGQRAGELQDEFSTLALGAQRMQFRESVESRFDVDISPTEVQRQGNRFTLTESGQETLQDKAVEVQRLSDAMAGDVPEQTQPAPDQQKPVNLDLENVEDRRTPGKFTRAPRSLGGGGTSDGGIITEIAADAASGVSPHARMTTGGGAALQARAVREREFAERAEEGFERLSEFDVSDETILASNPLFDVEGVDEDEARQEVRENLPSEAQVGAAAFQAAEITERAFVGAGRFLREESPLADAGPTLPFAGDTQLGDIPGKVAEFAVGGVGAGVGAAGQLPTTAQADIDRDAVAEQQSVEDPGDIVTPDEISEDTTAEELERRVAEQNPGVDRDSVTVTRDGDEFDIDTELTEQQRKERIAAANPGIDAEEVFFSDSGDPMAMTLSDDGQTPTEIQGGTLATAEQTAEAQAELAIENPYTTAALFALPAVETAGRFRSGFREGARGAEVVRARDITTEAGAQGEIPTSQSFQRGSTREAVREIETRAADQPDVVTEAVGSDQVLYHTTGARMGEPISRATGATGVTDVIAGRRFRGQRALEVGEGASEAPGLFVSPEMNPVGLRSTNIRGTSQSLRQYLRPRKPDLGGTDRVVGFPGDRVRGMPERAAGQGYEIRGPSGERLEGGLGRGQAKQRASEIDGAEVAPDVEAAAYDYLTQEARPGTAQVKPSGIRSSEIEAIFPPESQFLQRTGGPNVDVQFGGRIVDVPKTDIQLTFGGERVPMDAFTRAGESGRAGETAARAGESAGSRVTGEEIGSRYTSIEEVARQTSQRSGPASPTPPLSPTTTRTSTPTRTQVSETATASDGVSDLLSDPITSVRESISSPTETGLTSATESATATETDLTSPTSPTRTLTDPTRPTSTTTTTSTTTSTSTSEGSSTTTTTTIVPPSTPPRTPGDDDDEDRGDPLEEPAFDDFLKRFQFGVAAPEEIATGSADPTWDASDDLSAL